MSKVITKYRGYTATQLKTRAEAPDQADMTVDGNNVNCVNLTTTKIRNAVGGSSNAIGALSVLAGRNAWSGFGTKLRSVAAQALVNSEPSVNFKFGDHAGYNHGAVTPGWLNAPDTSDIWVPSGDNAEFLVDVIVGEVKWHEVANGIVGVVFAVYDGGALVGYVARNFTSENVTDDATGLYAYVQCFIEKTYTLKIWLVDSTDFGPEGFDGSQIVCRLPNTVDITRTVKIKQNTDLTVESGNMTVENAGFNVTAGTVGYTKFYHVSEDWSNVRVVAQLFNWLWEQVGSDIEMYNDAYFHGDEAFPTTNPAKPDGDPIDANGYHFKLVFYFTA